MGKLNFAPVLVIVFCGVALAAIQTSTVYERVSPDHTTGLHGEDFDSLVSVEETARPPGGGVAPAVIGPLVDGADYLIDQTAGTIQAAPGREAFWAKIVYRWDDTPSPEETEAASAEADCTISKPALKARIVQDLADIQQEMDRATQVQAQMDAQITAFASDPNLPTSPTTTQLRSAFVTLSTRYQQTIVAVRDMATGFKRSGDRFIAIDRLVACQAGIHIPSQGFR